MLPALLAVLLLAQATKADVAVITPEQAKDHVGQEVVVEGNISDVGYSARSETTFLNVGGKYPKHTFTAVIFRSARAVFPEAKNWDGKRLRISEVVKEYRGKPEIVLERAEQVNVLK